MATRTPILASVPYPTLPRVPHACILEKRPDVDDILDDLDSESDSGYDEAAPHSRDKRKQSESQPVIEVDPQTEPSSKWFAPLLDGPPLCSELPHASSEDEATVPGPSNNTAAPSWTRWMSSRVLCTDTVLATNEDRLECVWLLAGCEDGTVWIFCSVFATTGASGDTGFSTPRSRAQSDLFHNTTRSSTERPAIRRQKSDLPASRKPAVPSSPSSNTSKAGATTSRIASMNNGRRHRSSHAGSISLAVQGSGTSSSHGGTHTPVGRKASATISITDLEALGQEGKKEKVSSERPPSPPFRNSIASMSFDEVRNYEPIDHRQINFDPITHVYPRASHSPIVSVKLLPREGFTVPFVCLTANGQLFKFAVRDGMVIDHIDLGKILFPRSGHLPLSDCRFLHNTNPMQLLVHSRKIGLLVPVELVNMRVCLFWPAHMPTELT